MGEENNQTHSCGQKPTHTHARHHARHMNEHVLGVKTYDIDTLLTKNPKPGQAAVVTIDGEKFASPNENWRMHSSQHIQNHMLAVVIADLRLFFKSDFATGNERPKKIPIKVKMGGTPLASKAWPAPPKWAAGTMHKQYAQRSQASAEAGGPTTQDSRTLAGTKRNGPNQDNRQSKYVRTGNRERTLSAQKIKLRQEATAQAIESSRVPDVLKQDARWGPVFQMTENKARQEAQTPQALAEHVGVMTVGNDDCGKPEKTKDDTVVQDEDQDAQE